MKQSAEHHTKEEAFKVGKMKVEEFELSPEESTRVDDRVRKYRERVESSQKVL